MNFTDTKPIYLQIAQQIIDRITGGEWGEGERIPSVRELGAELGVNPNTCSRAFDYLSSMRVIASSRGVGYFVEEGAVERLRELAREEFFETTLPHFIEKIKQLDIRWDEIEKFYRHNC